jgi:hypothetical protein
MAVLVLAACSKSGGGDPKAVARGFVEAMMAGDVDKAKTFLPDDAACAKAQPDQVEHCKASAAHMRDGIGGLVDDFPKGAKLTKIEKSDEEIPVADAAIWALTFEINGETDQSEVFTMKLGDRYYAGFPFKVKSSD